MKLCGFDVGLAHPFFLISGPCVVESEQLQMDTAGTLQEICAGLGIPFIFKSSYDKANRRYATDSTTTTTTTTDQTGSTTAPAGTVDCSLAANANDPACANKTQTQQ